MLEYKIHIEMSLLSTLDLAAYFVAVSDHLWVSTSPSIFH